jgi:hypothetical protein
MFFSFLLLLNNSLRAEVNIVKWEKELDTFTEKDLAMELVKSFGDIKTISKIKKLINEGKYYKAMEVLGESIKDKIRDGIIDKTPFGKYKTLYEIEKRL